MDSCKLVCELEDFIMTTDWYTPAAKGKTTARQYYYYYCYNYCQNLRLKAFGWKACERKTIYPRVCSVDLKLLFNLFFLFIQLISKDETPIPRWGKRLLRKRKNKFFTMVLLFPVHSPGPFFFLLPISLVLICLNPFLSFYPQFFRVFCFFLLNVSSFYLLEVLSLIRHMFTIFFLFLLIL